MPFLTDQKWPTQIQIFYIQLLIDFIIYFLIHVFYTEPVEDANENEKKKTKNPKRSARPVWTVFLLHRKIIRIKQQRNANG